MVKSIKRLVGLRLATSLVAGAVFLSFGQPASAEWRRAESDRFIVYSDGSEAALRSYVQKLETFDRALRIQMGLPMDQVPPRKLPIFSVVDHAGLETVWPGVSERIVGYYTTGEDDIFAVAMRERGSDDILLHEYAHHFMYQNFAYAYPGWFSEGFAEYYATTDIRDDRVDVGRFSESSSYWLTNGRWIPLEDLLSKRPGEVGGREETYYPQSWLLTHWLLSEPERRAWLSAYLRDIGQGGDPVEAMQRATGMTMDELTRTLHMYMRQRSVFRRITLPFPDVPVTVTVLPRSADALLLLNQRLKRGVPDADRPALIAQVRQAAAPWPDDILARLVLARAELTAGDPALGETILTGLLEAEPANVEALQLMARAIMMRADVETDGQSKEALQRQARTYLGRAFAADDANFTTFLMLAESRRTASNYPTENDLQTLRLAVTLAPQLPGARMNLAAALIYSGAGGDEAVNLLAPVANNPHDAELAAMAQAMIERANGGDDARGVLDDAAAAEDLPEPEPTVPPAAPGPS